MLQKYTVLQMFKTPVLSRYRFIVQVFIIYVTFLFIWVVFWSLHAKITCSVEFAKCFICLTIFMLFLMFYLMLTFRLRPNQLLSINEPGFLQPCLPLSIKMFWLKNKCWYIVNKTSFIQWRYTNKFIKTLVTPVKIWLVKTDTVPQTMLVCPKWVMT